MLNVNERVGLCSGATRSGCVGLCLSQTPAGLLQSFEWPPVCASPKAADIQPLPSGPPKESLNSLALACLLASQDRTCESVEDTESGRMVKKMKKRICLVLDCLCAHDFSDKTADLINLQHYVIKEKRLSERETVVIFYDVVRVVEALHQVRPRTHVLQQKHLSWLLLSRSCLVLTSPRCALQLGMSRGRWLNVHCPG